jgi:general secretion pathway protein D
MFFSRHLSRTTTVFQPAGRGLSGTGAAPRHDGGRGLRFAAVAFCIALGACAESKPTATGDAGATHPRPARAESRAHPPVVLTNAIDLATPTPPTIQAGTGALIKDAHRAAMTETTADGDITLNFSEATVRDVVDAVLGQILHVNYTIDPKVQATITVQTARPISREAVLPTLESVFQANGIALVRDDDLYRVVPLAAAARSGALPAIGSAGTPPAGYAVQIIPLKFASAGQLRKVLEPFVPTGGVLQADSTRNLLIVSGTQHDIEAFSRLASVFDVDWMRGMSFGLFPLHQGAATSVAQELNTIMNTTHDGPLGGVVRVVPIERINAILLVSAQQGYIQQAKDWIQRLDDGLDESAPQPYVYYVQNSRAADLAKVLGQMFGGNVRTVAASTAPGSAMTRIALDTQSTGGATAAAAMPPIAGAAATAPAIGDGNANASPSGGKQDNGDASSLSGGNGDLGRADGNGDPGKPRIVADEKNNALVILARPRDYKMIENTVKKLDILPLQILIEATIAEVTLTDDLSYGVQWFFKNGRNAVSLSQIGTGAVSPIFPGFDYVLGGSNAQVVLQALSAVTKVNVISAPKLMVLDHQTAMLQVGDQVPVAVQQAKSVVNPDSPIVNTIELRDTGVILRVTPRVNANGMATLEIEQEVSDVTKTTTSNIDSPTIQQRRIRSVVAVGDGQSIALGGLIRDNKTKSKSGIPLISDIPILGNLASWTNDTSTRTELLILLTPRIIHNPDQARDVTDELQRRLRAIRALDSDL